ncbi:hypothetical protein JHK87_004370 [Glycine soja]|nr:hypothetical protein JHK87_004370 [Glycine soja]
MARVAFLVPKCVAPHRMACVLHLAGCIRVETTCTITFVGEIAELFFKTVHGLFHVDLNI